MPFVFLFCGSSGFCTVFCLRKASFVIFDLTIPAFPCIREVRWGAFVVTHSMQIYLYIYVAGFLLLVFKILLLK